MVEDEKRYARQLVGKTVVTKSGKRFGEVGNLTFETRTGELIQIVLKNPTGFTEGLELERDNIGNLLIPYSSVIAIGDFIVVSEEDII
ncbi:MAG TPA: PRC-barrel domain-containing protein [Candidatus Nanoarchaeia archaeon]|nr:PRC-barrel domain-containing protein [Candidatus Nanoarchaeia archaeon]